MIGKGKRGKRLDFTDVGSLGLIRARGLNLAYGHEDFEGIDPTSPFAPPGDEALIALIRDVKKEGLPCTDWALPVRDLAVHHPPTVERARAAFAGEPTLRAVYVERYRRIAERRRAVKDPWAGQRWPVYRGADGRLVMFDNYAEYVALLDEGAEVGLSIAPVEILNENAADLGRHEAAAGCGPCAARVEGKAHLHDLRLIARHVIRKARGPWDAGLCERHREMVLAEVPGS